MSRSAADYATAFQRLMPKGRVWRFSAGSMQGRVALALSRVLARVDAAVAQFLTQSLPGDSAALLPEWEATLGLEDSINGLTDAQRGAQIRSRFISGSGPSEPFIQSYAAELGFTAILTRYAPARAGVTTAGGLLYDEEWCSAIGITVITNTGGLPTASLINALEGLSAHIFFFLID